MCGKVAITEQRARPTTSPIHRRAQDCNAAVVIVDVVVVDVVVVDVVVVVVVVVIVVVVEKYVCL